MVCRDWKVRLCLFVWCGFGHLGLKPWFFLFVHVFEVADAAFLNVDGGSTSFVVHFLNTDRYPLCASSPTHAPEGAAQYECNQEGDNVVFHLVDPRQFSPESLVPMRVSEESLYVFLGESAADKAQGQPRLLIRYFILARMQSANNISRSQFQGFPQEQT